MQNNILQFDAWIAIRNANRVVDEAAEYLESEKLDEGKMKNIDILAQQAETKEQFIESLKDYVKEIGKPELADDAEFIEFFAKDFTPKTEQ